jgi:exopolyphosphatase/guanosine-5'-triphosphate,3'-diphosphate pyrophosphatase
LRICGEKLASHNIRRHRLIATEACRQAGNGQLFLDRVKTETGMDLEIIDRQTEAYLAAEGCGALMDRKADAAVLFDIGGGSSELVLVNQRIRRKRISDQIVSWTSVPIGVVTLAERHGGKTVNPDVFRNMINEVKAHLRDFPGRHNLDRIWKNGRVHLLGTSGTVTTLAGVHLDLPRYDRRQVDGLWMSAGQIDKVIADLLAMDYRQRSQSPCVGTERADLVMAGCAILEAIRETWPSERLRVADRGLREGILTQMMERDAAWLAPKQGRWRGNGGKPGPHTNNQNKGKSS